MRKPPKYFGELKRPFHRAGSWLGAGGEGARWVSGSSDGKDGWEESARVVMACIGSSSVSARAIQAARHRNNKQTLKSVRT